MKFQRILACILCVVTLLSLLNIGTFAQTSEKQIYTADDESCDLMVFGDSYSRGMGCSDTWYKETHVEYQYGDNQSRCVTGAYPTLLAEALGCKNSAKNYLEEKDSTFWPIIHNGLTLSAVLDLLGIDDGFYDSEFYHASWSSHSKRYEKLLQYFGCPESFSNDADESWGGEGTTYNIRSMVENMDTIVLQLGQGDVLNLPIFQALHEFTGGKFDFSGMSTADIAKFVARIIELAMRHYNAFISNYPLLLDYMTKANPDADILVLSIVNPAFGADLSDDIAIPVGQVFSVLSATMNSYLQKWCKEYGCTYVDITNVETATTEYDWSIIDDLFAGGTDEYSNYEIGTHPSPEGHRQIARTILTALENQDKPISTDITVDLGRFEDVSYVLLDGKMVQNYTLDENHVLTIPNTSKFCSRLTVMLKNSGKLSLTVYQLSYDKSIGYSAYRLYTKNDILSVAISLGNAMRSVLTKITSLVQN